MQYEFIDIEDQKTMCDRSGGCTGDAADGHDRAVECEAQGREKMAGEQMNKAIVERRKWERVCE